MSNELKNSISTDQLCKEYDWYQSNFPEIVQTSCDEFFDPNFRMELIGLSKNINCLADDEACFVTKIKIDKEYDMFFRLTAKTIDLILTKILGQSKTKFNINKISELEAKIITSFNDYLFEHLKGMLQNPPQNELKRNNFDVIHLTFIIKEKDDYNNKTGKVVISLPAALLSPEAVSSHENTFSEDNFPNAETFAKVYVGKTKFKLHDIKNLETEDVVVFENSNIESLQLSVYGETFPVKINPNMDILIPAEDDGGETMGTNAPNIWDSIEVEMNAEFDSVKVTLGELKSIENGLVVDLTSLYDNNVTLKVEGKPIASGSLVIVNDRYGVKINQVLTPDAPKAKAAPVASNTEDEEDSLQVNYDDEGENEDNYSSEGSYDNSNEDETPSGDEEDGENDDEEFDYSDFELEDENI